MRIKRTTILIIALVLLLLPFPLSGCGIQKVSPDPDIPVKTMAPARSDNSEMRLFMCETSAEPDLRKTHRWQEYYYDEQGRLYRIYAPEGTLACVSDATHVWELYNHDIPAEIEELYEYDENDRIVKITGYLPTEISGSDNVSYVITFIYDDFDRLAMEILQQNGYNTAFALEYSADMLNSIKSDRGEVIEYTYDEEGQISREIITEANGERSDVVFTRENAIVAYNIPSGSQDTEGKRVVRISSGTRVFTERFDYDREGRIVYRQKHVDNIEQTSRFWNYYYS